MLWLLGQPSLSKYDTNNEGFVHTHLPLDKMTVILAYDIFKRIFLNENNRIRIHIPLSPIDNMPVMLTQRNDAYMPH